MSIRSFQSQIIGTLTAAIKTYPAKALSQLRKARNSTLLESVAVYFNYGVRQVSITSFNIIWSGDTWSIKKQSYNVVDDKGVKLSGHAREATNFLTGNPNYLLDGKNINDKLLNLIKIQSASSPLFVSLPGDVVKIFNNGFQWTNWSGLCQP